MSKDIKILISAHRPVQLPSCQQFYGMRVGQGFQLKDLPANSNICYTDDMQPDNISDKNWFYCELTAQYYAYRHLQANYFGFMHYRRLLSFTDFKAK